jgi:hypothetical protein
MTDSPAPRSVDATAAEREELGNVLSEYLPFSVRNRDSCIGALLAAGYRKPTTPAVLAKPEAVTEEHMCLGCGSTATMESIKAGGFRSCCPERKMVTLKEAVTALWVAQAQIATHPASPGAGEAVKTAARTRPKEDIRCRHKPQYTCGRCRPIRTHKEG